MKGARSLTPSRGVDTPEAASILTPGVESRLPGSLGRGTGEASEREEVARSWCSSQQSAPQEPLPNGKHQPSPGLTSG